MANDRKTNLTNETIVTPKIQEIISGSQAFIESGRTIALDEIIEEEGTSDELEEESEEEE